MWLISFPLSAPSVSVTLIFGRAIVCINKLAEPKLFIYILCYHINCNWFIWARASSYVTVTSFIYVRSCNCYSMGIKAIIHSTSLHYGRVPGFSLWANDLLLVYGFIVFCMAWPARCSHVVMPSPIALWGKFSIFWGVLTLLHPGVGKNLSTDENYRLFKKFLRPYFKS